MNEVKASWRIIYIPPEVHEREGEEDSLVPYHGIQIVECCVHHISIAALRERKPCVLHIQCCGVPDFFEVMLKVVQSPVYRSPNWCHETG